MWWGILAFIVSISVIVMLLRGPVAGLGCGTLMAILFPSWIAEPFLGVPIDLRVATSLVLLILNVVHPRRRIDWSFNYGDWAVLAFYLVHLASDWSEDGQVIGHVVRAFGEWSTPYIAGRLAVQSVQDWRWLTGVAVLVATLLGIWSATEAITRYNIGTPAFGARPSDRTPENQIRNGLKRSEGPTRHPIWFGMIQMLLLPWTIVAAYRSVRGDGPIWWIMTPIIGIGGIIVTECAGQPSPVSQFFT